MPLTVPGCPLVPVTVWGFVVSTTPADGSSRQALIVREAITFFISALPFKTTLRIGDSCALEILQQSITNYQDFFEVWGLAPNTAPAGGRIRHALKSLHSLAHYLLCPRFIAADKQFVDDEAKALKLQKSQFLTFMSELSAAD